MTRLGGVLMAVLSGCGGAASLEEPEPSSVAQTTEEGTEGSNTGRDTDDAGALPVLSASVRVLDPKLPGATPLEIGLQADCEATIVSEPQVELVPSATGVSFTGLAPDGGPLSPGPVTLTATCPDGSASMPLALWVVRLGAAGIDLTGPVEGTGGHVSIAWHKQDAWTSQVQPLWDGTPEWSRGVVDGGADLDARDGSPASHPTVSAETHSPPWGDGPAPSAGQGRYSVPAAYISGTTPWVVVTPGVSAVGADGTPVPALGAAEEGSPEVRLAADSWASGAGAWVPGESLVLEHSESLPEQLGHHTLELTWRWEARAPGGEWAPVPGEETTSHPLYLLYDAPTLADGTGHGDAPPLPWFATLDELSTALEGVEPDPHAVLDAIHGYIHYHPRVIYNPSIRAYSSYEGEYVYWDRITFDLTSWLDGAEGPELYCHSTSCLFHVLAGSVGVATDQIILGHDFRTNLLQGAGTGVWDTWWFYSHSVVSPDLGATLWDAAASSDGDGDPGALPADFSPNTGVPLEDYLAALTDYPIEIVSWNGCFVR